MAAAVHEVTNRRQCPFSLLLVLLRPFPSPALDLLPSDPPLSSIYSACALFSLSVLSERRVADTLTSFDRPVPMPARPFSWRGAPRKGVGFCFTSVSVVTFNPTCSGSCLSLARSAGVCSSKARVTAGAGRETSEWEGWWFGWNQPGWIVHGFHWVGQLFMFGRLSSQDTQKRHEDLFSDRL